MKKSNLLFMLGILITLLVSCNETSSSGTSASDNPSNSGTSNSTSAPIVDKEKLSVALTKAQTSVNFNGSLTSIYVEDADNSNEGDVDITIADTFMEFNKTYQDSTGDSIVMDYDFVKDNDNKISYKKLNVLNQIQSYQFINPITDDVMDYDTYCLNPFKGITADDFSIIEDRYYLDDSKVSNFNGLISLSSTTRFHFYDFEISSVSISLSNSKFNDIIITTAPRSDNYLDPADFFLDCTFSVICPGEITLAELKTKDHRPEHDTLTTALTELQQTINGKNYTINAIDKESGGEFGMEYDNYATENGFYSDFKAALDNYKIGYALKEDGKYYRFKHYVSGDLSQVGDGIFYYNENSTDYCHERQDLEPNFLGFASEFFLQNKDTFYTTNNDVVDDIRRLVTPFYDSQDPYYIASKVFFNLTDGHITSWGFVGRDMYNGYEDTFTYSFKDVGTTKLPVEVK